MKDVTAFEQELGELESFDDHLKDIHRSFSEQLKVADQKAAYVLTVALAFVVTSSEAKNAFVINAYRTLPAANVLANCVLVASVATAMFYAVWTIIPRIRSEGSTLYWGAWPSAGQTLSEAKKGSNLDFVFEERLRSVEALASICSRKFLMVQRAFAALLIAAISYAVILMLKL